MKKVVAAVVTHDDHYCLLRRSALVACDAGLWHCVTGYLEPGTDPEEQVMVELLEELDAGPDQFTLTELGLIEIDGWDITVFRVVLRNRDVRINWEHDAYEWVRPAELASYPTVWWLNNLIDLSD